MASLRRSKRLCHDHQAGRGVMNVGRYQFLLWPRLWPLIFFRPTLIQRKNSAIFQHIYSWVAYVWPLEVRRFK